jgi:hypothetical protein
MKKAILKMSLTELEELRPMIDREIEKRREKITLNIKKYFLDIDKDGNLYKYCSSQHRPMSYTMIGSRSCISYCDMIMDSNYTKNGSVGNWIKCLDIENAIKNKPKDDIFKKE